MNGPHLQYPRPLRVATTIAVSWTLALTCSLVGAGAHAATGCELPREALLKELAIDASTKTSAAPARSFTPALPFNVSRGQPLTVQFPDHPVQPDEVLYAQLDNDDAQQMVKLPPPVGNRITIPAAILHAAKLGKATLGLWLVRNKADGSQPAAYTIGRARTICVTS